MNIRDLEIFLSVADTLHFGRASQACHLSPSALTRAVQRLEEEVGQPLFERDNRTVALTDAGERFRSYARQTLQDWQGFRATLRDCQSVSGPLSLYASVTAVYSLLPDLLEAFRDAYPEVQLELRTGAAEQAVALVGSGDIDLAVAALPDKHRARIEFLPITTTPLLFIASRRWEAAAVEPACAPLVLPASGLSRSRIEQWFREAHVVPNITSEVSGNEAIIAMVRLGCGVGIVPQLVLERSPFREEVRVLDGAPRLEPYVVGLCTSRRNLQRPAVRAFWQLAEERSAKRR